MKAVFLIERSPDVFHSVKSYLRESNLPFACFPSVDDAILVKDLPSIIILSAATSIRRSGRTSPP